MNVTLEVCVSSVEAAIAAQEGGADRVELCDNLFEGGTTPSYGAMELARKHLRVDVNVMVRPRGGDFLYSDIEFEIMQRDIESAKELGAQGVVLGLLNADGTVDKQRTRELLEAAHPLSVTFHRAFDVTRDPHEALEDLIDVGVDRVLTSGQEPHALEGIDLLGELVRRGGDRITVMVCGGVTARNARRIVDACGAKEIHVGPGEDEGFESRMRYRNPRVFMGGTLRPPEYFVARNSTDAVSAVVEALRTS